MNVCDDFQKWTIITLSAVLVVSLVGLVSSVYGQSAFEDFVGEHTVEQQLEQQEQNQNQNITVPQVTILAESKTNTTSHFEPKILTIHKGDTVKWINNDTTIHTVTSGKVIPGKAPREFPAGAEFDSPYIIAGKSYTVTFYKTGNFDYYCILHPNMTSTIKVIK